MALTADVEIPTAGNNNQIRNVAGGAADTLFKGAMVNIGTDGKIKVAANVAAESTLGVMVKQVITLADDAEVEVETGLLWIAHSGAALTDVGALFHATDDNTLADGAGSNVKGWLCVGVDVAGGLLLINTEASTI